MHTRDGFSNFFLEKITFRYKARDGPTPGLLGSVQQQISSLESLCFSFKQRRSLLHNGLTKNQERITLPSTISDRQSIRVKCKNVCKAKAGRLA